MVCLDHTDINNATVNMKLFGPNENTNHRKVEIMLLPSRCNATVGECNHTERLAQTKEKLGQPNFIMIRNNQRLDFTKYGEKSIKHESIIENIQTSGRPTFTAAVF